MPKNFGKLLSLFFILVTINSYGQQNRPPSYLEGVDGLNAFFRKQMDLEQFDLERNFRGTIVLRLHVDFLGRADSIYVWFSPSKALGEEALRVMELTRESWNPARKNGAFSDGWVQYSYHICREYYCGHSSEAYEQYKRKSIKAFLDGDRERGIEFLRKAIYVEPSHGEDFHQLAKVLIEEGEDPEICTFLELAQELTGNLYPEYLDHCGEPGEQYLLSLGAVKNMDPYEGVSTPDQADEGAWFPEYPGDRPSIDDRYPGGLHSLGKFLAENFSFPKMSVMKVPGGLSVASLTISPEGLIEEVAVLNQLGSWMDEQAFKLLQSTRGRWKDVDHFEESQSFIIQINYTYKPYCDLDDRVSLHNDSVLREIVICGVDVNDEFRSDGQIRERAREFLSVKQYPQALPYFFELIRRDPFNSYYQEQVAACYQKLGWKEQEAHIRKKLESFYEGDSLVFLDREKALGCRRIVKPMKNGGFSVREIRLDSSIIYSGKLSGISPEIREGTFYFYGENGRVRVSTHYQDDYPFGIWLYYNDSGEIKNALDYNSVFQYLAEEEANPFVDSVYMGRADLGANERGSFTFVNKMPRFRGSDPAYSFAKYLREAVKSSEYAQYHGIEGSVLVQFTIDQEGRVRDPSVVSGVHPDLNMEALRVIISSPRWTPGKMGRDAVGVVYTFPVKFRQYGL